MKTPILRLKRFCGYLVGIVFFLSGIVKLMDPTGAGLVMKEYYDFLMIGFMAPTAKVAGTLLAMAETLLGAALVIGVWRKLIAKVVFLMQAFFTVLTLLLVIFNPQMDCGCFGEAIHLTHLQTFIKNIILLAMLLAYMIPFKYIGTPKPRKYVSFAIIACSTLAFAIYSWIHIPLIDFTDYKADAILKSASTENTDEIYGDTRYIYEKDGVSQSFSLDEIPDSTWTFVEVEENVNQEAMVNTIELPVNDPVTGNTKDFIATDGMVLITSVYDTRISEEKWEAILRFQEEAIAAGFKSLLLVSDTENIPEHIKESVYTSDYKTLISMNRSNGGVTYFNDGRLIAKWSAKSRPDQEEIHRIYSSEPDELYLEYETEGRITMQSFLLYVFAVMLLL